MVVDFWETIGCQINFIPGPFGHLFSSHGHLVSVLARLGRVYLAKTCCKMRLLAADSVFGFGWSKNPFQNRFLFLASTDAFYAHNNVILAPFSLLCQAKSGGKSHFWPLIIIYIQPKSPPLSSKLRSGLMVQNVDCFWGRAELSVWDDKVTALNMCLFEA